MALLLDGAGEEVGGPAGAGWVMKMVGREAVQLGTGLYDPWLLLVDRVDTGGAGGVVDGQLDCESGMEDAETDWLEAALGILAISP